MSSISLDRDPLGTFILSCRFGSVEIGQGKRRWQAFGIEPRSNGLTQARLYDPQPSAETPPRPRPSGCALRRKPSLT